MAQESHFVYAFKNFNTKLPEKMIVVGILQSKSKSKILPTQTSEYDVRKEHAIVLLIKNASSSSMRPYEIHLGQTLYIVDTGVEEAKKKSVNIIGEVQVVSKLKDSSGDDYALGVIGNLLRVREGRFVVRTLVNEKYEQALSYRRQGDSYLEQRLWDKSQSAYKSALALNENYPEAFAGLGRNYFLQELEGHKKNRTSATTPPKAALENFKEAELHAKYFSDALEELEFYDTYMEALYYSFRILQTQASREKNIVKYIDKIIELSVPALDLEKKQASLAKRKSYNQDINFSYMSDELGLHLARAYYSKMRYHALQDDASERKKYDFAKKKCDIFLKELLERETKTTELVRVAILFYGHRYKELNAKIPKENELKLNLKKILQGQLGPYYDLYLDSKTDKRDSEVREILESLNRDR